MAINNKTLGLPASTTTTTIGDNEEISDILLDHNTTEEKFQDGLFNALIQIDQTQQDLGYTSGAEGNQDGLTTNAPTRSATYINANAQGNMTVRERLENIETGRVYVGQTGLTLGTSGTGGSTNTGDISGEIRDMTIRNNAVTTAKINNSAVTTAKIAADAVTNAKIADNAIQTENITDLHVTNAKINANAVTTAKIADANITTAKIADANITTAKIADNAVTTAKIPDDAVTNAKLENTDITVHGTALTLGTTDNNYIPTFTSTVQGTVPATGTLTVTNPGDHFVVDSTGTWVEVEDWAFTDGGLIPASRLEAAGEFRGDYLTIADAVAAANNARTGGTTWQANDYVTAGSTANKSTYTFLGFVDADTAATVDRFIRLGEVNTYTAASGGGLSLSNNAFSIANNGVTVARLNANAPAASGPLLQYTGNGTTHSMAWASAATVRTTLGLSATYNVDWSVTGTQDIHINRLPLADISTIGVNTAATTIEGSSVTLNGNTTVNGTLLPTTDENNLGSAAQQWDLFANDATISNNATVGGTLGITGATTAAAITASGDVSIGGDLTVTGDVTTTLTPNVTDGSLALGSTTNRWDLFGDAVNAATVTTSGAATLDSAAVTNNATVGGTLGVTGNLTASANITDGTNTIWNGTTDRVPATAVSPVRLSATIPTTGLQNGDLLFYTGTELDAAGPSGVVDIDGTTAVDVPQNTLLVRTAGTWQIAGGAGGGGGNIVISDTAPTEDLTHGTLWYDSGSTYRLMIFNDPNEDGTGDWLDASPPGVGSTDATLRFAATPPANPTDGTLWYDSDEGRTYVWSDDAASWVDIAPAATIDGTAFTSDANTWSQRQTFTDVVLPANSVGANEITDNSVGAAELNVSGNGTSGQYLSSDGDGSMSWVDAPSGGSGGLVRDLGTSNGADANGGELYWSGTMDFGTENAGKTILVTVGCNGQDGVVEYATYSMRGSSITVPITLNASGQFSNPVSSYRFYNRSSQTRSFRMVGTLIG